jgi:hypothetical protein
MRIGQPKLIAAVAGALFEHATVPQSSGFAPDPTGEPVAGRQAYEYELLRRVRFVRLALLRNRMGQRLTT